MHMDTAFPSKFLKASDLKGKTAKVIISRYGFEDVGDDKKLILYFEGKQKGLVANKTNATTISLVYGTEMDNWIGGELELFMALVDFQGRQVEAIRVRVPPRRPNGNVQPVRTAVMSNAQGDDWQAPPASAQGQAKPAYDDGFDDAEVPF